MSMFDYSTTRETKFKVGDWVICRDYTGNVEIKQYQNSQDFVDGWYKSVKLWQPKEGEWCWYINKNNKNQILGRYGFENDLVNGYDYIEPFIGELPSFIKDLK